MNLRGCKGTRFVFFCYLLPLCLCVYITIFAESDHVGGSVAQVLFLLTAVPCFL